MDASISTEPVCIAGAGQMGTGIAYAFAAAGFPVTLVDVNDDVLQRANTQVGALFSQGVSVGKIDEVLASSAMGRLKLATDPANGAEGAALFIETVSENIAIKSAVIERAETSLAKNAIIATNTSALSVTEIAAQTQHPDRVIGMHFFNPVQKMKLVEIVLGLNTSLESLARVRGYCDAIGKTSIVVNETPGLTTSRMSAMLGNEAMTMLQEGTATAEDIDTALRMGLNHPMGPLELGDLTGWDTRLSVLQYLHRTLGEKFRPCPLIIKMVASGRIGRKAGAGVYEYDGDKKIAGSGLKASAL